MNAEEACAWKDALSFYTDKQNWRLINVGQGDFSRGFDEGAMWSSKLAIVYSNWVELEAHDIIDLLTLLQTTGLKNDSQIMELKKKD